jgi:O-antigen/teichoic acid export membrane protein
MTVLLARWLSPSEFGAFAVAFAVFLFVSGLYNALVLEPLTVIGPSQYGANLNAYFRGQLAVHIVVVGLLSLLAVSGGAVLLYLRPASPLGVAIIGGGLALPFLLLLWLARRMCYIVHRLTGALCGSTFNLAFVLAGLFIAKRTGFLTPFTAFMVAAVGSLLAGVSLLFVARIRFTDKSPGIHWCRILGENWSYGKWVTGSALLNSFTTHVQTILVSAYLGLYAAGIFRAMQVPMLGLTQILTASGPLILPAFARDFAQAGMADLRQKAILTSILLGTLTFILVAGLALLSAPLEKVLYGGNFSSYALLMPVLGVVPACTASCIGCAMAMRAIQQPQFDLIANLLSAPASLVSALCLLPKLGIMGAAIGMVVGSAVYMTCTIIAFRNSTEFRQGVQV